MKEWDICNIAELEQASPIVMYMASFNLIWNFLTAEAGVVKGSSEYAGTINETPQNTNRRTKSDDFYVQNCVRPVFTLR